MRKKFIRALGFIRQAQKHASKMRINIKHAHTAITTDIKPLLHKDLTQPAEKVIKMLDKYEKELRR